MIGQLLLALGLEMITTTMRMIVVRAVSECLRLKSWSMERKNSYKKVSCVYSYRNIDQAYGVFALSIDIIK